ncbi:BamA/TamA family outer membrane protein [Candidatus Poribacteria bacterium]
MKHFRRFGRNANLALFILLLILWNVSYSIAADSVDTDTKARGRNIPSFLPFVIYTPETRWGGGIGGIYTFHIGESGPESRPSSFSLSTKYTQNEQYSIDLTPRLYLKEDKYYLESNILYQKFPLKFYGIGNSNSDDKEEDYTPKEIKVWVSLRRNIYERLRFGIQYNVEHTNIDEVEEGGLLDRGDILGYDGSKSSGVGLLVDWDSRDRVFSATKGAFYQASVTVYRDALGSDFDFTRYILDLRRYYSILPAHSLALNGYFDFSSGEMPFQKLALLGGRFRMRGYYEGQHRDKNMMTFQIEYRIVPVWWRGGVVGFLGVGDVSDKVSNFQLKDFKAAGGIGFRFQFNRGEGVNLRADFAFGRDTSGYYLTIQEAF